MFLRIFNNTPSFYSFWVDEATFANRSIYILDHGGLYNPDYLFDHPPLFMYVQSAFFAVFGTDWFVARGVGVFLGIVTLLVFFLIGKAWRDEKLGLLLAAIFAVQPMMVEMNRQAMMENLLLLLLSASFLAVIKFDRTGRGAFFLLGTALFGLAMITKFTAAFFIFPLGAYALIKKLHKERLLYISAALFLLIVLPVVLMMLPHGFIDFHLRKTSGGGIGYYVGGTFLEFGHLAALVMTLDELNIGILPFVLFLYLDMDWSARPPSQQKLLKWARERPKSLFLAIWAVSCMLFFSLFTFMTAQYIYTMLIPILILLGIIVSKRGKLFMLVVSIFLLITVVGITYTESRTASNDTVEYLKGQLTNGDVLICSDQAVFSYYFPDCEVHKDTDSEIASVNATYMVLKTSIYDHLKQNATLEQLLGTRYSQAFETHEGPHAINFIVLKRVD